LAQEAALLPPKKKMLEVGRTQETSNHWDSERGFIQEKRVALVPESVAMLVGHGHDVIVETNAGKDACFQDKDYSEAGARIVYDTKEVFQSNIILKVAPPSLAEVNMMPGKQTLLSALQLTVQPVDSLKTMMAKKITAVAWDYVKDETDIFPVVRSMGEIAGNTSVLIAAEYLSNVNKGQGLMFGGISGVRPTEVVILGAGTVGEFAARAALGLGASVKVFDNSMYKLRRLQNDLGQRLWTSTFQPSALKEALANAGMSQDFIDENEVGILFGNDSTAGAVIEGVDLLRAKKDTTLIGSGNIFQSMNSTVTMNLSTIFRLKGVNFTISAACASGSHSIGMGYLLIKMGLQKQVVCGGAQEINPYAFGSFDGIGTFSTQEDEPSKASKTIR